MKHCGGKMIENSDVKIIERISAHVDLNGKKVLEVGCGQGRITKLLIEKGAQVTAVDPDKKALQAARKMVPKAKLEVGSGEKLKFKDESFHVVIFTLSLHHQQCQRALDEADRVLVNGGDLLVIEPVDTGEVEQLFNLINNEEDVKQRALDAVMMCDGLVHVDEIFHATWCFDDAEDVVQSVFDYYGKQRQKQVVDKIMTFLDEKGEATPIELQDSMRLFLLKKVMEIF